MTDLTPFDSSMDVGLEDVDTSDVVLPRLSIVHKEGKFKDSLSGAEFETLDAILLGLTKQRIMWDEEVDDGDKPLCKSPDHKTGFPNMDPKVEAFKRFPWGESGFDLADHKDNLVNGHVTLSCGPCPFKEWTTNNRGKSVPPRCSEQHTYALLYTTDEGESWTPAIISFQRTGIKPSKSYLSSFMQKKRPLFTVRTRITLDVNKRGDVVYSVPAFRMGDTTESSQWNGYAETTRSIRDYLQSAPRPLDGEEATGEAEDKDENTWTAEPTKDDKAAAAPKAASTPAAAPKAASTPAPAAPVPAEAVVDGVVEDDDDMPF